MLQVERWNLEWDNDGREKDLVLEVDPANKQHFTDDLLDQLKSLCKEVSNRFNLGVSWAEEVKARVSDLRPRDWPTL
ncbi:hypothetical protein ABT173_22980 [Streptomyces sp. NPDC001795]|uniref:hypothetical protein n=1 Tax=Streptomyces sp. NPDC001795 TaxID=3154525 RepID=UPI00332E3830